VSSSTNRPGPRIDLDVRNALLDTAELLFGAATIDAVSLRAVAREAGVGSAAVSYHFESKQDLVRAVVDRRGVAAGDEIRRRCQQILDAEAPRFRDLVDAVLVPLVDLVNADPVPGLAWLKTYTQLGQVEDPIFLDSMRRAPRVDVLFMKALGRLRGDGDRVPVPVQRRGGIAMFVLMQALSRADMAGYGARGLVQGGRLDPEYVEQLALFATAGMMGVNETVR
jgi:AcrR family transcriptional regulator